MDPRNSQRIFYSINFKIFNSRNSKNTCLILCSAMNDNDDYKMIHESTIKNTLMAIKLYFFRLLCDVMTVESLIRILFRSYNYHEFLFFLFT